MNQSSKSTPTLVRFFVALTGALIVVSAAWKIRHPNNATRNEAGRSIASLRADTSKRARFETKSSAPSEGKARGSFSLAISADDGLGGVPDSTSQAVTRVHLKGRIIAQRHIAPHDFTWILPANYKMIDGAASGVIPELQPGQTHDVRVTIDRGAEPLQPVVLHVFKFINSEPRGQVAQFDFADPLKVQSQEKSDSTEKSASRLRDERYVQ